MATTFNDLFLATSTITNRPDLVTLTNNAIKKAILKEHSAMDYPADLRTLGTTVTQPSPNASRYQLSLATLGLANQARKIDLISEIPTIVEPALWSFTGYWGQLQFKERAANNLFDEYHREYVDYYMRMGDTINLVSQRQVSVVGIQYYNIPDLSNLLTYTDWLANKFDYVIYEQAAADVFKAIGKDEEAATYRGKMADNRLDVIKAEIGAI